MRNIVIILIGLSAIGFILSAIAGLSDGQIFRVGAFGFSQGSISLSLIAIALCIWLKGEGKES